MAGARAAIRYAKAVLSLASDRKTADAVNDEMKLIASTIAQSKDLSDALQSPVLSASVKKSVLLEVFKKADKTTLGLIDTLVANNRIAILADVAAKAEANPDTGMSYHTQWLERNRFEVHPENAGTAYEVLLGLLGKERLQQLGRGVAPREAGPQTGCLWFEETGHNVCDQANGLGFKSYWQSHGLKIPGLDNYARSLQLFGLPLTGVNLETNANGDTVQTQWFERARLEWHPNNPDQFKVLLGLLGKEVYDKHKNIPKRT